MSDGWFGMRLTDRTVQIGNIEDISRAALGVAVESSRTEIGPSEWRSRNSCREENDCSRVTHVDV